MELWLIEVDDAFGKRIWTGTSGVPKVYFSRKSAIAHARKGIARRYSWHPVKFERSNDEELDWSGH